MIDVLDVQGRDDLGEGPWWDTETGVLHWIDLKGHRIRSAHLDGSHETSVGTASEVGFAVPTSDGSYIAGLRDGLYTIGPDGAASVLVPGRHDVSTHRINDGKTDRAGRLWYGLMEDVEKNPTSELYRLDASGARVVLGDVITSNGLGWSPDDSVMYYTDSLRRTIRTFEFDPVSGEIANPRVFAEDPTDYVPDGLTVDAEGFVWAAKWDGGKVVRYAPDGSVDRVVRLPVRRPTSCMFAGDGLDVLVVTSAMTPGADEPLGGAVFVLDVDARGLPETRVRVPSTPVRIEDTRTG